MRGKRRQEIATLLIIVVCAVIAIGFILAEPKYEIREDFVDKTYGINYSVVNVRKTPRGQYLGELTSSDVVILTGEYCKFFSLELDPNDDEWIQIYYEGEKAWITFDAIED